LAIGVAVAATRSIFCWWRELEVARGGAPSGPLADAWTAMSEAVLGVGFILVSYSMLASALWCGSLVLQSGQTEYRFG